MTTDYAIDFAAVCDAAIRIADRTVKTPCVYSEQISQRLGCEVYFKAENLQHIGAFKARGALNAVRILTEEQAQSGVVTHSSGNHAAALARAASIRGIEAHIVMPHNSAAAKISAVQSYGIEPVFCEPTAESRAAVAAQLQADTGAVLIHPYNHPPVMAGQGTVGLEILEQVADVDVVLAPVGGGGLMSGLLTALQAEKSSSPRVYAAEPAWADDAYRSLQSGRIEAPLRVDSIADGLRSPLGENPFPIIRDKISDLLLVEENAIRAAMREITEVAKLVCEPSGAVSFGALVRALEKDPGDQRFVEKRIVVVITGGNLDMGACKLGA